MSALRDALRGLPDSIFTDLLESDDEYLLVIDLPGATAETVTARIDGHRLHLEAQREKEVSSEFLYLQESRSMFLDAELPLPPDATETGAEATMHRGVLELRIPKESAGTRISITEG